VLLELRDWLWGVSPEVLAHEARREPGGERGRARVSVHEVKEERGDHVCLGTTRQQRVEPVAQVRLVQPEVLEIHRRQLAERGKMREQTAPSCAMPFGALQTR